MQVKQQIEDRMRAQRKVHNLEHVLSKFLDGIADINKILDNQRKSHEGISE